MPETEDILKHIGDRDDELLGGDERARDLPRALVGGTLKMREGVPAPNPLDYGASQIGHVTSLTRWLPPEPAETEAEYRERVWRSYLTPFYTDALDLNVGRVFLRPPTLDEDADSRVAELSESITLLGDNWTLVARDRFWHGLDDGVSYILVDHPPIPKERDTAATDSIARPYWVSIDAGQVLGISTRVVDASVRLTEFRYCESVSVRDGLMTKRVDVVRWFVAGNLDADGDDRLPRLRSYHQEEDSWVLDGETIIRRPGIAGESEDVRRIEEAYFIPIVPFYGRRKGPYRGRPYFRNLADLNLQHFQKRSDLDRILHSANVPILAYIGFSADGDGRAEIGATRAVRVSDPTADVKYVEHTGSAIGMAMQDVDRLEARLSVASLEPLIRRATGSETATARLIDEAKGHSVLAALAMGLQDSLENAFKFTANWLGQADGPSVSVNTDFGISMRDATELQALATLAMAGKLSTPTLLEELRRRGIISEEVDIDAEVEALQREGPGLGEIGGEDYEVAA